VPLGLLYEEVFIATYDDRATLLKLSDTDWTVADPAEDPRGRKVLDKQGEEIAFQLLLADPADVLSQGDGVAV
jgi:hypothetical protein